MAKESRTKYVILGLLANGAETGYDIKSTIEKSISFFWSESYGQIYPALKKLQENNWVEEVQSESLNKRDKKRYAITPKGLAALDSWVVAKTEIPSHREEVLLKIFLCARSGGEAAGKILCEHQEQFEEKLIELQSIEKMLMEVDHPSKEYWLATLRFGLTSCEQRVKWSQDTLTEFRKANILK
ncbi:MAG: PadR family transcriptional regulator [Fibrobacterales bacterium]